MCSPGTSAITFSKLSGEVNTKFGVLATVLQHARSGKLKLLAYLSDVKSGDYPDLPLLRDIVPGYASPPYWMGYLAPAGLPDPLLRRLHGEIVRALNLAEVKARFEALGFAVIANSPAEFRAQLFADVERVGKIVNAAGIQPE